MRRASLGVRIALAAMLGVSAALLVACGGAGSAKLIPTADAGPLQTDFETVAQDAEAGNGECTNTEAALTKTQQDFEALPSSVDAGLRERLAEGIRNLRTRALVLCAQPLAQATVRTTKTATTRSTTTQAPPATTTQTETTTTATAPTTPIPTTSTPTATTPGGGTAAPGEPPTGAAGGTSPPTGGTGEAESEASKGAGVAPGAQSQAGAPPTGQEALK